MNELNVKDPEYKRVLSSYYDLLKTSILREDKKEFIGGLPITLLRRHTFNLLQKSRLYPQYSKYTVTSKVDGTRLLMFINEADPNNPDFRKVHFIDRSMNIYVLSNKEKHSLNSIKSPKMLIDGELVFFKDNKSNYYLESSKTDYLSFMVFDILYGPISISIEDPLIDIIPKYGSANAMAGPIGGKQWTYGRRFNILKKLILPHKDNGNNPPLSLAFCESPFFRIELKKILYISELPVTDSVVDYINNDFLKSREDYFNFLNKKCETGKSLNEKYKKSILEFDGLIFTPIDTEYVIGNWNKFMNTQYKWKPTKEQTIDFLYYLTGKKQQIKGQIKEYQIVDLYVLSKGEPQLFDFNGISTGLIDPKFVTPNGVIGEFGFNPKLKTFILNRLRLDKNKPNAWRTAQTVKESILFPVDINLIPSLYEGNKDLITKTSVEYLNKNQINRLLLCTNNLSIFTPKTIKLLSEMMDFKFKSKEAELEVRLGKLTSKYFNTGLSKDKFIDTNKIFDGINWKYKIVNYVDTSKDSLRTRYQFVKELNKLVKLESITKKSVSKLDISLSYLSSFDIRISSALEENTDKVISMSNASEITEKKRISYYDPNGVIRVDLTEVTPLSIVNEKFTRTGNTKYQIEFEILKNDINSVIKFLEYYIYEVETTWD